MKRHHRAGAIAAVLALTGAACCWLGVRADASPAPTRAVTPVRPVPKGATPVWSPRRVPALFVDAVEAAREQRAVSAIGAPYERCVAVDGADGPVARVDAGTPLAAASTQKLLVAAAALATLGAGHHFETKAVATAPLRSGALAGDLVIVGGGDPVLTGNSPSAHSPPAPTTTALDALADQIARAGIRTIDGALVADDSLFDRVRAVADWKPSEVAEGDVGALGALVVDGGLGADGTPVADPALDTVEKLGTLLAARGVHVGGGERDGGGAPADARVVARIESPPLGAIVEQMLTFSNNETAELLTKAVGKERAGNGTTAAGIQSIVATLAGLGVPTAGIDLHDGSGLAPSDRVTCDALLHVVELAARPRFAAIDHGLPIAGQTGTLADRFVGTPLGGRLRAKTGHIDGVVGLAGVVGGTPVSRFAFVANGDFSTADGENLQDAIAAAVAAPPDAAGAAAVVPAP